MEALKEVQALAIEIINKDPELLSEENARLNKLVNQKFMARETITI